MPVSQQLALTLEAANILRLREASMLSTIRPFLVVSWVILSAITLSITALVATLNSTTVLGAILLNEGA